MTQNEEGDYPYCGLDFKSDIEWRKCALDERFTFKHLGIQTILSTCGKALFVEDDEGHHLGILMAWPEGNRISEAKGYDAWVKLLTEQAYGDALSDYAKKRLEMIHPDNMELIFIVHLVKQVPDLVEHAQRGFSISYRMSITLYQELIKMHASLLLGVGYV
jgi:hypothetical protein